MSSSGSTARTPPVSRREDLWRRAASALRDGRDPFDTAFLSRHGITLNECYDLADDMATGLDLLASVMGKIHSDYRLAQMLGVQQLAEALYGSPDVAGQAGEG